MIITAHHYLIVATILFGIGLFGLVLNRRNLIVILMAIEVMLLAVNLTFVTFSANFSHAGVGAIDPSIAITGQVFALFVLSVAAAEAAIGLAILVIYFRRRSSIKVTTSQLMKG